MMMPLARSLKRSLDSHGQHHVGLLSALHDACVQHVYGESEREKEHNYFSTQSYHTEAEYVQQFIGRCKNPIFYRPFQGHYAPYLSYLMYVLLLCFSWITIPYLQQKMALRVATLGGEHAGVRSASPSTLGEICDGFSQSILTI